MGEQDCVAPAYLIRLTHYWGPGGSEGLSGVHMPHSDPTLAYAWLIPLFPLLGFFINGVLGPLTGKPLPKALAGGLATAAVFASFAVACALFQHVTGAAEGAKQATVYLMPWLNVPTDSQGMPCVSMSTLSC